MTAHLWMSLKRKSIECSSDVRKLINWTILFKHITCNAFTIASASVCTVEIFFTFVSTVLEMSTFFMSEFWLTCTLNGAVNSSGITPEWTLISCPSLSWLTNWLWDNSCRASWIERGIGLPSSSVICKYNYRFILLLLLHNNSLISYSSLPAVEDRILKVPHLFVHLSYYFH